MGDTMKKEKKLPEPAMHPRKIRESLGWIIQISNQGLSYDDLTDHSVWLYWEKRSTPSTRRVAA